MLTPQHASVVGRQRLFGYTNEELRLILQPMAKSGAEPIGSMGTDTAIACSRPAALLYDYFTQLFAQVTNPPLDASVRAGHPLLSTLGPEANVLEPTAESCRQSCCHAVIDNDDLAKLVYVNEDGSTPGFSASPSTDCSRWRGGEHCARPSRTCGAESARPSRGAGRDRPLRPQFDGGAGADPVPAPGVGRPPPPGPEKTAPRWDWWSNP